LLEDINVSTAPSALALEVCTPEASTSSLKGDAPAVVPGTRHLGTPASAREAALEKTKAGEHGGVEHTALRTHESADVSRSSMLNTKARRTKRKRVTEEQDTTTRASEVASTPIQGRVREALKAEAVTQSSS
jgi:hypothetical protein